jgi:RNA recognition motif-containing protein
VFRCFFANLYQCGEIVEVRFPSLQAKATRRFCYVQFLTPEDALKATKLEGTLLDNEYRLQAKISDPSKKDDRHGPMAEGREVFVRNLDWAASEAVVEKLFVPFGPLEKIRIPRSLNGKSKGVGFIVFEDKVSLRYSTDQK